MKIVLGLAALLVAPALGHRVYVPPSHDAYTATTTATPAPALESNLAEYEDDYPNEVDENTNLTSFAITDSPASAVPVPLGTNSTVLGYLCLIQSVAYPGEYLRMGRGYWHYYPQMRRGEPLKKYEMWDWPATWKIETFSHQGETLYTIKNNDCSNYLTYNGTRYSFVRGTQTDIFSDNTWIINARQGADGSLVSTIQHSQHPNGYLHAFLRKKMLTNNRDVGISTFVPDKDIYEWKIVCDKGKDV